MNKHLFSGFLLMLAALASGDICLKSGDSAARFSSKIRYALLDFTYKGTVVCNTMGYNGSVIAPDRGKFIGMGHKEGGLEQFVSMELTVDGKTIENPEGEYTGDIFTLKRTTKLDNTELVNIVTMKGDLYETKVQFKTLASQKVDIFYVHQYCWSDKMYNFTARLADDSIFDHTCTSGNGFFLHNNPLHTKWFAFYDEAAKTGLAAGYDQPTAEAGHSRFWDRINTHKLYYVPTYPKTIEAGWTSPVYTFRFRAFTAEKDNWKSEAEKIVPQLTE